MPRSDEATLELAAVELKPAADGTVIHASTKSPQYSAVSMILTIMAGSLLGTIDQG
jgi:hypothetical protein